MNVAIVGCGNIAGSYSKDIKAKANLRLVGFYDIEPSRAEALAAEHGGRVYRSFEELLADEEVDIVVNLTIFEAHYQVSQRALAAGKHVYSEKPLALRYREAKALVELARAKGLRLACAPITFLGEAPQTAMKLIREGGLGRLRVVYAEVNHGRIESWHPNPAPFYAVGPMLDVGVYPLALVSALLGPARSVTAFARTLKSERVTKTGEPFTISAPDFYVVLIEFDGVLMRLSANFYVSSKSHQGEGVEFHGDAGSLYLASWFQADAALAFAPFGEAYAPVPLVRQPAAGLDWARGLEDFAEAIASGRPARVTGEHAAHLVEILEAINASVATGQRVSLSSSFTPPAPMAWAQ